MANGRGQWGSRLGFILAAAGSAVGLGNIWSFPYRTGENGGGLFVIVYLLCVALIGLPVMMAEIFIGRTAQTSPVGAYRALSSPRSPWLGLGWLSVVAAFIILSFYSVIAGWCLHYTWLSVTTTFSDQTPDELGAAFESLVVNGGLSSFWHAIFMVLTIGIVVAGVHKGIEACSKVLMPALFICMLVLLVYAVVKGNFGEGLKFVFAPDFEKFEWSSVLAAMGQAFFSLSLGMGALLTYGSYLKQDDDLVSTSMTVCALDTSVALLAAIILFPILFAAGQSPAQGPGLVFATLPIAFSEMPGGVIFAPIFFLLLTFAALTSSISLLEVATAYFIDERGWSRSKAAIATGGAILVLGIPSAISASSALFGDRLDLPRPRERQGLVQHAGGPDLQHHAAAGRPGDCDVRLLAGRRRRPGAGVQGRHPDGPALLGLGHAPSLRRARGGAHRAAQRPRAPRLAPRLAAGPTRLSCGYAYSLPARKALVV